MGADLRRWAKISREDVAAALSDYIRKHHGVDVPEGAKLVIVDTSEPPTVIDVEWRAEIVLPSGARGG